MPTPAKVLTILVILAGLGWLVLASMATQRNRNWGQKIKQMDETIASLQGTPSEPGQVAQMERRLAQLKDQIDAEQVQTSRDSTVLRERLSDVEALVALTREDLTRLELLVRQTEEQVEQAQQVAERRAQEKMDTETAIAKAESELARLRESDAQLRERRDSLFRELQAMLADNKRLVQRIQAAQPSSN